MEYAESLQSAGALITTLEIISNLVMSFPWCS